jgi:hypothetical protein
MKITKGVYTGLPFITGVIDIEVQRLPPGIFF